MSSRKLATVTFVDTLGVAAARMAATGYDVIPVIDEGGKYLGMITDPSIRTALLDGMAPDSAIEQIVDERFPVVRSGRSKTDDLWPKLSAKGVSATIRLQDHRPVEVIEMDRRGVAKDATAVVMAGGRGQRLRPLTDKVPKPLLRMGDSTIVERIIAAIGAAGIEKVYLSVNYKARVFESKLKDGSHLGVKLEYLKEQEKLGTAGSLQMVSPRPKGPVLVTNADIMTRLDYARILKHHELSGADATIGVVMHAAQIPYGVIETKDGRMIGMTEKPQIRVPCNAGIYVLAPSVLARMRKPEPIDMPDLLVRIIDNGGKVSVFPLIERWFDIGSPEDFQKVLLEFATGEEE